MLNQEVNQERKLLRIGHRGAAALAPENSAESFDAALAAGVNLIEFDVLPERNTGRLIVAHDYEKVNPNSPFLLSDALTILSSPKFGEIQFIADLKLPNRELGVVDQLNKSDLIDRTIVASAFPISLRRIRTFCPKLRLGWSVPRVTRDYTKSRLMKIPAAIALSVMRKELPIRAKRALNENYCDLILAYSQLVTRQLVLSVNRVQGQVFAWTVDSPDELARLAGLGVDGVITNNPKIFHAGH